MNSFIEKANLPRSRVTCVICGELCCELNRFLDGAGIERIVIEPNGYIDSSVASHADMAAIHLGGKTVVIDKKQSKLISELKKRGLTVIETENEIAGEYPCDVALNFAVIGNRVLGNFKYADKSLTDNICDYQQINVRQGYCKCSCLIVNENAIITDDCSIYHNASENGLECLLIAKGDIHLDGHEYGFIGGASGKISDDEILFFGDITKHRNYKDISAFIEKHGCKISFLDFPLTDFGGLVTITEKAP